MEFEFKHFYKWKKYYEQSF